MTKQINQQFDFGSKAESYESWYKEGIGLVYAKIEKQALNVILPSQTVDMRLLEVGCGTGYWCDFFAQKGFEVVGVDISEKMIEVAKNSHKLGCKFIQADGENLPFSDGSFDVVAAVTTVEFANNPLKVIEEMARCVKKKNGIIIIGSLNSQSSLNQNRRLKKASLYGSAKMYNAKELAQTLSRYGKVDIRTVGFAGNNKISIKFWRLGEFIGRLLKPYKGAFLIAKVKLKNEQ